MKVFIHDDYRIYDDISNNKQTVYISRRKLMLIKS